MSSDDVSIVVMGPSGSGKSTVGESLANALGIAFIDADDLHPSFNKEKMSRGVELTDEDRLPWLRSVGVSIIELGSSVCACSALKRTYRDVLRNIASAIIFIELDGSKDLIFERLNARTDHFMPSSQLDSQVATLEPLETDELGFRVLIDRSVADTVSTILVALMDFGVAQK